MPLLRQEVQVWSLGQEGPLKKEMATHSQYSCLGNPTDEGVWWVTVHGVAKELDTTWWLNSNASTEFWFSGGPTHLGIYDFYFGQILGRVGSLPLLEAITFSFGNKRVKDNLARHDSFSWRGPSGKVSGLEKYKKYRLPYRHSFFVEHWQSSHGFELISLHHSQPGKTSSQEDRSAKAIIQPYIFLKYFISIWRGKALHILIGFPLLQVFPLPRHSPCYWQISLSNTHAHTHRLSLICSKSNTGNRDRFQLQSLPSEILCKSFFCSEIYHTLMNAIEVILLIFNFLKHNGQNNFEHV